jgi:hypothetical protein
MIARHAHSQRRRKPIIAATAALMGALDAKAQEQICAALALDLRTASAQGARTPEDRLAAVEAHTRHLQEAVLELCPHWAVNKRPFQSVPEPNLTTTGFTLKWRVAVAEWTSMYVTLS